MSKNLVFAKSKVFAQVFKVKNMSKKMSKRCSHLNPYQINRDHLIILRQSLNHQFIVISFNYSSKPIM